LKSVFSFIISTFLLGSFSFRAQAQELLLENKPLLDSIKISVQALYNFRFDRSVECLSKFQKSHGNHPGLRLLACIRNYWKFLPIGSRPAEYQNYKNELTRVIRDSETMMKKYPKSPEPSYFFMTANLMLARHHSEDGEYLSAVNEARKAFPYIKEGFSLKTSFLDYYFSTGLYNYYREAFPENHNLYKPFTFFFPEGNKEQGLKELSIAASKSIFSAAEARVFLCNIILRDYYDVPKALEHSTVLHRLFPNNWVFTILYAETLAESGKFAEAEKLTKMLLGRTENAAQLAGHYIQGFIDKKNGRIESAKWNFLKALSFGKSNDRLTKGHIGLTYNELAKLSLAAGNKGKAEEYFDLAQENCSYKKVINDRKSAGF
jgi:hypothetical protein